MKSKEVENQIFNEAQRFIVGGLGLIKTERFTDASTYFRNPQKASHFGLILSDTPRTCIITKPIDDQAEADIVSFCQRNSWFNKPVKGKPEIVLAEVLFYSNKRAFPSKRLSHELALISAEEWLHALQYFKSGSLTGYKNHEIDIAAYLIQQGIPLTNSFLSQHNRRKGLLDSK